MIEVKPLSPRFGAVVTGVDMRKPPDAETVAAVVAAANEYAVLVFHNQDIDDDQQIAFSAPFGPLGKTTRTLRPDYTPRIDPRMIDVSNVNHENRVMASDDRQRMQALANRFWHTDNAFRAIPAKYSLLSARAVPPKGGETEFADMRAAYDALPDKTKAFLEGKVALHSIVYSREAIGFTDYSREERDGLPAARQAMVRTHPGSGRKTLYLASYAHEIEGMPTPEARVLLHDLIEHATQRQFVYTHPWRVGDVVLWDDCCTMHRARPYDLSCRRELRRTTVMEDAPTVTEARVA